MLHRSLNQRQHTPTEKNLLLLQTDKQRNRRRRVDDKRRSERWRQLHRRLSHTRVTSDRCGCQTHTEMRLLLLLLRGGVVPFSYCFLLVCLPVCLPPRGAVSSQYTHTHTHTHKSRERARSLCLALLLLLLLAAQLATDTTSISLPPSLLAMCGASDVY